MEQRLTYKDDLIYNIAKEKCKRSCFMRGFADAVLLV